MLKFNIQNQTITRTDDFSVVGDSKNYLIASFSFSDEWTGPITAIFDYGGHAYCVILKEDNTCTVPWEVIKPPYFTVSVFCGDLITANVVSVGVEKSGYKEGETPAPPTPDVYTQILSSVKAPYIGDNGNWHVYDAESKTFIDTNIKAEANAPQKGTDYWTPEDEAKLLQSIQYWQPYTDYTAGQIVLCDGYGSHALYKCTKDHTSSNDFLEDCDSFWDASPPLGVIIAEAALISDYATTADYADNAGDADFAQFAHSDINGNSIPETYATKEEFGEFGSRMDNAEGHAGALEERMNNVEGSTGVLELRVIDIETQVLMMKTALNYPIEGTEQSLLLVDKELSVFNEPLTSLTVSLPEDISGYVLFDCSFVFTSGETATTLSYSADSILWAGDDCDADGVFVPEANKTYEVYVRKLGNIISARVGVIVG